MRLSEGIIGFGSGTEMPLEMAHISVRTVDTTLEKDLQAKY